MKKNYCFVKTIVQMESYKEVEEKNGITFAHFGAVKADGSDAYECAETSMRSEDFNLDEAKEAYEEWKASMDKSNLAYAKKQKLADIDAYDQSDAVNSCTLNGKQRWLDVSLRQSLAYTAKVRKEKGHDNLTVWFGTESEVIPIEQALDMLNQLEVYAKQTNNVTHEHKAEVGSMESLVDVEDFDVSKDYPSKLEYIF